MTLGLRQAPLSTAIAVSLAIHAVLAAALGSAVRGWQPGEILPGIQPPAFLASLRAAPPVETPAKPAAASARPARGPYDAARSGAALPRPHYYGAAELTERPLALAAVNPGFPRGTPASGRLKLRLYISEQGSVDALDITEAEPAGAFEQAAAQAFAAARFRPGHKDGAAVKSQIALEVRFGEPLPLPARTQAALALPENPNAYDAPDRVGIKTRRSR
jgi:TonB family protein